MPTTVCGPVPLSITATGQESTMKAIVNRTYGSPDHLKLQEIEKPVISDDGVLVQVRAASVNPLDWHLVRGQPYFVRLMMGLRRPRNIFLGADVAGIVEAVGKDVTQFKSGDAVLGACRGAFAEYVCVSTGSLAPKPADMTFEHAAAIPVAGLAALQALRDHGQVQPGHRVLINGAAGGVGTFAVQIARAFGAHVTGVCSTRNIDMVESIGADVVVDYSREDFTRSGQRYDLIVDAVGNRSLRDLRRALSARGTLVMVGGGNGLVLGPLALPLRAFVVSRFVDQRMIFFIAKTISEDLVVLTELIESGKVTPIIDRTYLLSETPEAVRYIEAGHARGKVVITV